ncbi:MAG: right-handed parallel beta-helix repeat-containing protein [Candidatus Lokiarchaeota archaeon]
MKNVDLNNDPIKFVKGSAYWDLPFKVHIYNNWSETALTYEWCSGSGTWSDPFIIENITIDSQYFGNAISIEYTSVYFKIRNCKFDNADYGIHLNLVDNGHILNCSCSNNHESGIYIKNCENNTIENNILMDSGIESSRGTGDSGILCFQSSNNHIINNQFYRNNWAGIEMQSASSLNFICNNTFKNNYKGIYIVSSSHDNNVTKNFIELNEVGVHLLGCSKILVHNNSIIGNSDGIYSPSHYSLIVSDCSITNNLIFNSSHVNILLKSANNTLISGNEILRSPVNGMHFFKTNYSIVKNNKIIDHHENGIMMVESDHNSFSYNNISKSQTGVFIENSDYNNISMNRISQCTKCIIQDSTSKENIIEDNICIELPILGIAGYNLHTIISSLFVIGLIFIFYVKRKVLID